MKLTKSIVGAAVLGASSVAVASDAVLSSVTGTALVNQGDAFVTAQAQSELNVGDRLMVLEGGEAVVTYADGCDYTLTDNQVLTIGETSSCTSGQAAAESAGTMSAAVGGVGAGGAVIGLGAVGVVGMAISVDSNGKGGSDSPR